MNIEITGRNFSPSEQLKSFINEKVKGFSKFDSNINLVKVVLLKEGRAEKVELIVSSKKKNYITKCYSSVFEKTIINAIDKVKVQISKSSKI
jgi:ribosomal subunit interface protein